MAVGSTSSRMKLKILVALRSQNLLELGTTMAFTVGRKSSLLNNYMISSCNILTFISQFTSTSSLNPVSESFQGLDSLEREITYLCQNPNNSKKVFLLFEKYVDMSFVPSGPLCDRVLQTLSKNKEYKMVFLSYKKMTSAGASSRYVSLSCLLECLVNLSVPESALAAISLILKRGYFLNVYDTNIVLNGLCSNGFTSKAEQLLGELERNSVAPDRVSFNTLIKGFCRERKLAEALQVKNRMELAQIDPNLITYNILLGGFFTEIKVTEALRLFEEMKGKGLEPDIITYSTLIKGFCSIGDMDRAVELSDGMSSIGIAPINTVLTCLCDLGKIEDALKLLEMMQNRNSVKPDSITICTLVRGLCRQGRLEDAEILNREMVVQKQLNGTLSYTVLIQAYLKEGNVKKALKLWREFLVESGSVLDSRAFTALIDGLCKCCCTNIAKGIFTRMRTGSLKPTCYEYNVLMTALCRESSVDQVRGLFRDMINGRCEPDVVSYNIVIDSVIKAGDIQYGNELVVDMLNRGLKPDALTYSVLINRLSKAGLTKGAKTLLEKMKSSGQKVDAFVYDSLLKGFIAEDGQQEIMSLLHEIADIGVVLDRKLASTILACLDDLSDGLNVTKLPPNFTQKRYEASIENVSCVELLNKFQHIVPELTLSAAQSVRL